LPALFDNLIRPQQQRRWDREAECFGGLRVNHQLERGRLLDGEVAGFRALEDLVDVGGAPSAVRHAADGIRSHRASRKVFGESNGERRGSSLLSPRFEWLRGLDLNQRPLGYEPFSNRDWSQRATNNAW